MPESGAAAAVTAVILAGGAATRMGGRDKGLLELAGRPMVEYVIDALRPQAAQLLINANRNLEIYQSYGFPVFSDQQDGFEGPLAGMASCMARVQTPFMVTAPCDSPFVPRDLVDRLMEALRAGNADISVAHDGERMQPVFSLLRTTLLPSLTAFLAEGQRKIDRWYLRHATITADFSDQPETFANVNTPEDIRALEQSLQDHGRLPA